jgi:hypothetical protein
MGMDNDGGMISTEETLIRPLELPGNPTISHLVAKYEKLAKKMDFALRIISFIH